MSGLTIQVGGARPVLCPEGSENDRAWFARNVGRSHRIRRPTAAESGSFGRLPDRRLVPLVAVRQICPGRRIRIALFAPRGTLNSEAAGREAFEAAREAAPWVGEIERQLRGMP